MSAIATAPLSPSRGIALILIAVIGWVCMDTTGKYLVSHGYPVWQVVWARYAFHLVVMLPVLLRGSVTARTSRPGLQMARSLMLVTVTALVYTSLGYLPLATVTSIGFLAPLLITALSVPILGEKVGPRRWAAVAAGFLGVLVVIRPNPDMHPALLLPVAVAFFNAVYQITTRILSRSDRASTTLFWTAVGGFAVSSLMLPFNWQTPDMLGWGLMAILGTLGCVSHMLMIQAYASAPAAVVAPFVYTQLLWVIPVGLFVFGDMPDAWTWIGAVVIVGSGLYVWYRETVVLRAGRH